jgi:hypothetical protein
MALSYRHSRKDLRDPEAEVRPTLETQGGRRLSKPRTKTLQTSPSSPALDTLPAKHSPASIRSKSTVDLYSLDNPSSPVDAPNRVHRASVDNVGTPSSLDDASSKKGTSVRGRISRTGTILSNRASVRLSLGGLKSTSRLSLPASGEDSTEEEKHRILRDIRRKAKDDSTRALSYAADGEVGTTMHTPIRRRSLFTPGLATRDVSDVLKRPPEPVVPVEEPMDDYDYYYNSKLSDTSPLGRIAALDLADGRQHYAPASRCSTPGDFDQGLIGSGAALRITNGAASPGPSILSLAATSRKVSDETYHGSFYTASEGDTCEDELLRPQMRDTKRRSFEFVEGRTTPRPSQLLRRVNTSLKGPRPQTPSTSPLRAEHRLTTDAESYFDQPLTTSYGGAAHDFAQQYIDDLSGGPFVSRVDAETLGYERPVQSIEFESTTKDNEFDAALFDDPASRPVSREQPGSWTATYTTSDGETVRQTTVTYTSSTVVHSLASASPRPPPPSSTRPGPAPMIQKGDSGYSSTTSLTSLGQNAASPMFLLPSDSSATTLSREDSLDKGKRDAGATEPSSGNVFGTDTPLVTTLDETGPMPRPMTRMQSRLSEPPPSRGRSRETRTAYRPSFEGTKPPLPDLTATHGLDPIPGSPVAPASRDAEHAAEKKSRGRSLSRPGKKLQKKLRPKSMPPPTNRISVASHRDVSGLHVPEIPASLSARNATRHQDCPPLDHTVTGFTGEGDRGQSVGTAPVSTPLKFPSPNHSPISGPFSPPPTTKGFFSSRRLSFSKKSLQHFPAAEEKPKRPSLEPTKSWRRRSRQPSPELAETPNISDFGDISALGHSPYDIATPAKASSNTLDVRSKRGSLIHPHQLTSSMPRAKSMFSLTDAQAAELSQLRTYYNTLDNGRPSPATEAPSPPARAPPPPPAKGATPPRQLDEHKHESPARRSSRDLPPSSRRSFDDRGGRPGKLPRAKSIAVDTPPVPVIPVRAQVDDMERQAKADHRRRSIQPPPAGDKWAGFSAAWAQRRKSAGEGLLHRSPEVAHNGSEHPKVEIDGDGGEWNGVKGEDARSNGRRWTEGKTRRPEPTQAPRIEQDERIAVHKSSSRASSLYSRSQGPSPAPRPPMPSYARAKTYSSQQLQHLVPSSAPTTSTPPPSTSTRGSDLGVRVQEGIVARLSGRFEGAVPQRHETSRPEPKRLEVGRYENGFEYGFERGRGVGGSAGTRGSGMASRKSIGWSRGYGVDLSDVPIMITAADLRNM